MASSDANEALKIENLFSVDGLVAVVTGGGSGKPTSLPIHSPFTPLPLP